MLPSSSECQQSRTQWTTFAFKIEAAYSSEISVTTLKKHGNFTENLICLSLRRPCVCVWSRNTPTKCVFSYSRCVRVSHLSPVPTFPSLCRASRALSSLRFLYYFVLRTFLRHSIKFFYIRVHGSVHRESNLTIVQQDATYSVYYITVGSSTCFWC